MSKVIFTIGLPSSGKSTWSKKYCIKNPDWVRVSRDDLRNMAGKYWVPKRENLITDWEFEMVLTALDNGRNVIVDATNLNPDRLKKFKDGIRELADDNTQIETKFFDVPVEKCIKRDLKRENSVGEKVIRGMYDKYLNPIKPIQQDKSLPRALIVDLDGTLAIHKGRSPYEYDKCDTDLPNTVIVSIIENYLKQNEEIFKEENYKKVIFMSGREDSCELKTIDWISKHTSLDHDYIENHLFMRRTGDKRPDYIVKKELFDKNIKDKYYVEAVFDDRSQVVRLWRDMGLTCLQVNDGDF